MTAEGHGIKPLLVREEIQHDLGGGRLLEYLKYLTMGKECFPILPRDKKSFPPLHLCVAVRIIAEE